ncbi:MAG TPA: glycosyltransferase [Hyphomicrobiaceae bacterium]|nr:glycosyltransferase [Hyphomicrobiaceae bacterium]
MSAAPSKPYRVCIVYQMDPRGAKVGGIETHVRTLIERYPGDFEVLLVGVDAVGDLKLGAPHRLEVGGRPMTFIPVLHYSDSKARDAARSLLQSLSLQFARGVLRYTPAIRRIIGRDPVSFELQRNETAFLPALLRRPSVLIVHNEYKRDNKTDSLVSRYWKIYRAGEAFAARRADRIICVNPAIKAQIGRDFPAHAGKAELMTVSVNTDIFRCQPQVTGDGILRLAYAGRFEAQKDPPLMFRTIRCIADRIDGKVQFHYVGTSDPSSYPEFAAIDGLTVRHGFQKPDGVARILGMCHATILTSNFEGLPVFLLESLASGRPMGAIRLPQFDPLIIDSVSGFQVERRDTPEASAEALAERFVAMWAAIRDGRMRPEATAEVVKPYTVDAQLPRLFAIHRSLQDARWKFSARTTPRIAASAGE